MPYPSEQTVTAAQMYTNAAWVSPQIVFQAGTPPAVVDISGWLIDGVAVGARGRRVELTVSNSRIVIVNVSTLQVSLTAQDMADLGVGEVTIEVMRRDPAPIRPIALMKSDNRRGVAP